MAEAVPERMVSRKGHYVGLYVERHNSALHAAECRCGWKWGWGSAGDRTQAVNDHMGAARSENQHLSEQK